MSASVHLVVLIHGLWGRPAHLAAAKDTLLQLWAESQATQVSKTGARPLAMDLEVVIASGMASQLAYDGIDVCASRVAWEVDQAIARIEDEGRKATHFSVTGYSLGGLIARYLVGLLHSRSPSFFEKHRPCTFSTIATPHLGIPRYNTFLSTVLTWLGARLLSRSGEQLYAADRYSDQDPRSLLEIMADPKSVFMEALRRFDRLQVFANGYFLSSVEIISAQSSVRDTTVPYPSAAITTQDDFVDWEDMEVTVDEDGLVQSWRTAGQASDGHSSTSSTSAKTAKPRWRFKSLGSLPPALRYPPPYNYLIMLLFPILFPLLVGLIIFRLSMDSRKSQRRLADLASISARHIEGEKPPELASAGLSVHHLSSIIRRVEHELETDLLDASEVPGDEVKTPNGVLHHAPHGSTVRVRLKESQLRMAAWLNTLTLEKHIAWFPSVSNSHAVIIVRDPDVTPTHNLGRKVLCLWARGVLQIR